MRLQKTYYTSLTTEEIHRNIRRNMSHDPQYAEKDFPFFSEIKRVIDIPGPLRYNIPYEHKVIIRSKGIFYWPKAEVSFSPDDSGTMVTIKFSGSVLALIAYTIFALGFIGTLSYLMFQNPSDLSPVFAFLAFSVPIALIPIFLRKIQNNIIARLQYS